MELLPEEFALLDFEREWWMHSDRKTLQIPDRFGMSPSSYYRALHSLIERPEAFDYDPLTVMRVRRRRDQARRGRMEGRRADPGPR
ncbi:MAG TPA: DUF3263 domain-containing protein [Acidimicrobiia bacterium]|nr:DUF3263 domain-containing protein [Acidimicrobiia bacterium]